MKKFVLLTLFCFIACHLLFTLPVRSADSIVVPSSTNAIQLRFHTNAAPAASHLFNTFDIQAYGEKILHAPGSNAFRGAMSSDHVRLHYLLVNGEGPALAATNNMTVVEQASGPDWKYLALDAGAAYRGRLEEYKRSILFIAPDLFVLWDHLVAKNPASFEMVLHPSSAIQENVAWRDWRLELPKASLRIHTLGTKALRYTWRRIESPADRLLPGTVTMQLVPTNKLASLDLLTVFAVYPGGEKRDYTFKLLESNSAIGARIHREGWPTLVAFKLDPAAQKASLTGFGFSGPVGVDVFKPTRRLLQ